MWTTEDCCRPSSVGDQVLLATECQSVEDLTEDEETQNPKEQAAACEISADENAPGCLIVIGG